MQITLNEDEIIEAVKNQVLGQIAVGANQDISIALKAGRGENGFTATLDIVPAGKPVAQTSTQTSVQSNDPKPSPIPKSSNPFAKPQQTQPAKEEAKAEPQITSEPDGEHIPSGEPDLGDTGPLEMNSDENQAEETQPDPAPATTPVKTGSIFSKAKAS